jgi:hypothetical protein
MLGLGLERMEGYSGRDCLKMVEGCGLRGIIHPRPYNSCNPIPYDSIPCLLPSSSRCSIALCTLFGLWNKEKPDFALELVGKLLIYQAYLSSSLA